jgi:hypothetical protein
VISLSPLSVDLTVSLSLRVEICVGRKPSSQSETSCREFTRLSHRPPTPVSSRAPKRNQRANGKSSSLSHQQSNLVPPLAFFSTEDFSPQIRNLRPRSNLCSRESRQVRPRPHRPNQQLLSLSLTHTVKFNAATTDTTPETSVSEDSPADASLLKDSEPSVTADPIPAPGPDETKPLKKLPASGQLANLFAGKGDQASGAAPLKGGGRGGSAAMASLFAGRGNGAGVSRDHNSPPLISDRQSPWVGWPLCREGWECWSWSCG